MITAMTQEFEIISQCETDRGASDVSFKKAVAGFLFHIYDTPFSFCNFILFLLKTKIKTKIKNI